MTPDHTALVAHAEAIDALVADSTTKLTGLIEARGKMAQFNRSPMREMALAGLDKLILNLETVSRAATPYARSLRLYVKECESGK